MRIRVLPAVILFTLFTFFTLFTGRPASAGPISLTFEGVWGFHDPSTDVPTFWDAMATYGVTTGTPTLFSMTIDENAPGTNGVYLNAIQRAQFSVGSLSLECVGTACNPTTNGSLDTYAGGGEFRTGPSIVGLPSVGYDFAPSFFDFRATTSTTSTSLTEALADPASWQQTFLHVGFADGPNGPGGGGIFLGDVSVQFVSKTVAVPEMPALTSTVTGFLLVALILRVRSGRGERQPLER